MNIVNPEPMDYNAPLTEEILMEVLESIYNPQPKKLIEGTPWPMTRMESIEPLSEMHKPQMRRGSNRTPKKKKRKK